MMKRMSFQLSFKIFQWMLVLIIIFSTYLGYQFYQMTFKSQAIENQRFWVVTILDKYRIRTDNLSYLARQYLINLNPKYLQQYDSLKQMKNPLVFAKDEQSKQGSDVQSSTLGNVIYRPFAQSEQTLLDRILDNDRKLRLIEAKAFDSINRLGGRVRQSQRLFNSALQTGEYLKLNLDVMTLINQVLDSVNKRFQQKVNEMEVERASLIYTIPAILCINLILIVFSFLFINRRMEKYHSDLEGLSIKDFLTGVHNRKYLMETGPMLLALNRRERTQAALLLLDIDHFKVVNDKYGHDTGDRVLKAFSDTVIHRMRKGDIFSRFGGEEFVLMLNKITAMEAERYANELRVLLASQSMATELGDIKYTVSIGVIMSDENSELKSLIDNADKALYKAKHAGRDRVVMFEKDYMANSIAV